MTEPDPLRAAYRDRAYLIALLCAIYPGALGRDNKDPERPIVAYINTPCGQLSWHIDPEDCDLFFHVPAPPPDHPSTQWDGHSTLDKYLRILKLVTIQCTYCPCCHKPRPGQKAPTP